MKQGTRITVLLAIVVLSAAMVVFGTHLVNSIPPIGGDITTAMRIGIQQALLGLALMGAGALVGGVALEFALTMRRESKRFRGVGR